MTHRAGDRRVRVPTPAKSPSPRATTPLLTRTTVPEPWTMTCYRCGATHRMFEGEEWTHACIAALAESTERLPPLIYATRQVFRKVAFDEDRVG